MRLAAVILGVALVAGCRGSSPEASSAGASPTGASMAARTAIAAPVVARAASVDAAAAAPAAAGAATATAREYERVSGDGYEGVIAPLGRGVTWRPSPAQVAALEAKLGERVAGGVLVDGRRRAIAPAQLARYKRVYAGVERDGARRIAVELACAVDEWPPRGSILGDGGGACFLDASWDPATSSFVSLRANSGK